MLRSKSGAAEKKKETATFEELLRGRFIALRL